MTTATFFRDDRDQWVPTQRFEVVFFDPQAAADDVLIDAVVRQHAADSQLLVVGPIEPVTAVETGLFREPAWITSAPVVPARRKCRFPDRGHGPCSDCREPADRFGRIRAWLRR